MSGAKGKDAKNSAWPVGLVVEGGTEFHALPRLQKMVPGCPPLKAANCDGIGGDASAKAVALRTFKHVQRHVASGLTRIIVCVDREARTERAGRFAAAVQAELAALARQKRCTVGSLAVVVADRAFEAWVLADAEGLHARGALKKAPKFHCFEGEAGKQGRAGKRELAELLDRQYSETQDGPRLFAQIDVAAARDHGPGKRGSRSFDKLLRELGI